MRLARGRTLTVGRRTLLMGVVNVTPDSFSDGGRYLDADRAVEHARRLAAEGADILDIGGESTRPGARPIDAADEVRRVLPVIARLARQVDVPISIDTTKAEVARAAVEAGASMVNDVSGLAMDPRMAETAAETGAGLVIGHVRGVPATMQQDPRYDDVVAEVMEDLRRSIGRALEAGVARDAIVVDPGFGFGKLFEHNIELLRAIPRLRDLGFPVLVGLSRKAMTGHLTGSAPAERLPASLAAASLAAAWGADIARVHDVAESRQALLLVDRTVGRVA